MKVITIDPGHGGWDPGAVAVDGQREKQFNLALSLALRSALSRYRCQVVMTRETDVALAPENQLGAELRARAAVANQVKADLLISIHHDSAGSPDARGGSIWVWTDKEGWLPAEGNHKAPKSYALAQAVYPHVKQALAEFGVPWRGSVWCSNFGILRETAGPAILLEAFFGSNAADVAAARQPGFIPALAGAVASGVAFALDLPLADGAPATPGWNPEAEIAAAKEAGLINTLHPPDKLVTWGEFATVLNRLVKRIDR